MRVRWSFSISVYVIFLSVCPSVKLCVVLCHFVVLICLSLCLIGCLFCLFVVLICLSLCLIVCLFLSFCCSYLSALMSNSKLLYVFLYLFVVGFVLFIHISVCQFFSLSNFQPFCNSFFFNFISPKIPFNVSLKPYISFISDYISIFVSWFFLSCLKYLYLLILLQLTLFVPVLIVPTTSVSFLPFLSPNTVKIIHVPRCVKGVNMVTF